MTNLEQYKNLNKNICNNIYMAIKAKGVKSDSTSAKVLVVKDDDLMFNLDGGRYLVEISEENLIDNNGYQYGYSCITLEELAELADYFSK